MIAPEIATSDAGTRIRAARKKEQRTQKEVAAAIGISASYLNDIEHNRRVPTARILEALSRTLCVPVAAIAPDTVRRLEGEALRWAGIAAARNETLVACINERDALQRWAGSVLDLLAEIKRGPCDSTHWHPAIAAGTLYFLEETCPLPAKEPQP